MLFLFLYWCIDWKNMVISNTTYPFTHNCSPYVPAVNKMPSLCAIAKECDIFSFELHSNMLNLHWNGDVFNQEFVISPRTGVLHACMSPKRQNLIILASGEKWFLFRIRLKGNNSGLIYGRQNKVELHRPILDIIDCAKMSALFQLTPTFNAT